MAARELRWLPRHGRTTMKHETTTVHVAVSESAGKLRLEVVSNARHSRLLLQALHQAIAKVRAFIERLEVRLSGDDVSTQLLLGATDGRALSMEHHGALMAAVVEAIGRNQEGEGALSAQS
jgi:predicted component of type VI protein secretion system